ncbi:MAG: hypothetical protein HY936_06880 [Nitrosomonadales bacterium]|nr:hypothetical protein [Nitrosomonadales bacterium]
MDSIRNPFKTGVLWPNGQSGLKTACKTNKPVIPAKAGIQTIKDSHAVGQHPKHGFVRYAVLFDKLDSRLRGNDGVNNYLG